MASRTPAHPSDDDALLAWNGAGAGPATPARGRLSTLAGLEVAIGGNRVSQADVAWMLDKLATTQGAGLPIYRAVGMLAKMRAGTPLGARLATMQQQMSDGVPFADALAAHREDFGALVCALVSAGEQSGSLERALTKSAALTAARLRLRRKIRGALMYPISVIVMTTGLIAVLLMYVVPKFADIYAQAGGNLPALTQGIIGASNAAPTVAIAVLAVLAAGWAVVRRGRTDEKIGLAVDRAKLRVPVLGNLVAKGVHARIAATLANLLGAGVQLPEALRYAASVAGNRVYVQALADVRAAIDEGSTLPQALHSTGVFPDLLIELADVGEDSGELPKLMDAYAAEAEDEVATTAEGITSMLQPLMMGVIGGVVGLFLIGLYMPIIDLGNQIQ